MNVYLIIPKHLVPRKQRAKESIHGYVLVKCAKDNIPKKFLSYKQYSLEEIQEELKKPEWEHKLYGWDRIWLWFAYHTMGPRI